MLHGELYRFADDPDLIASNDRAQRLVELYNASSHSDPGERRRLLDELLGHVGAGTVVQPPFRCDYGGRISIGAGTFINYGCVILDAAPVSIGASCQIASGVQLLTATHPLDPDLRRDAWELAHPVTVGDNVWLGAGAIVTPGVTIGDDSVVGAGSVVTRDLPAGVVAYGVPARVSSG